MGRWAGRFFHIGLLYESSTRFPQEIGRSEHYPYAILQIDIDTYCILTQLLAECYFALYHIPFLLSDMGGDRWRFRTVGSCSRQIPSSGLLK